MKSISLTQGKVALVSDYRYEYLNQWKWQAQLISGIWYATRREGRPQGHKVVLMHRQITNAPGDTLVDHWDGDGLNNQDDNLRVCTRLQNNHNRRKSKRNTSGYKGVTWNKHNGNYLAQIMVNYKNLYLGSFADPVAAALAYDAAARLHYGEFAKPNFPSPVQ